MLKSIKSFINEEDGMGTVEIVLIIAVLVGLALLFQKQIVNFVTTVFAKIMGEQNSFDPKNIENKKVE